MIQVDVDFLSLGLNVEALADLLVPSLLNSFTMSSVFLQRFKFHRQIRTAHEIQVQIQRDHSTELD